MGNRGFKYKRKGGIGSEEVRKMLDLLEEGRIKGGKLKLQEGKQQQLV